MRRSQNLGADRTRRDRSQVKATARGGHGARLTRNGPGEPALSDPVRVRVTGAPSGADVVLRARACDGSGEWFETVAEFVADAEGVVDPVRHRSMGGSYAGRDPFGLWWSMASVSGGSFQPVAGGGLPTRLTAEIGSRVVAELELRRPWLADGVRMQDVRDGGLVARLFVPSVTPAPAVLTLGGSDGGLRTASVMGAALANEGFAALALAYFGADGLPPSLHSVSLEYVGTAIEWLMERDEVAGEQVGVVGRSRGGELALLLGATFPAIGAVIACAPSGVIWSGYGAGLPRSRTPAWTWRGAPLPFVDRDATEGRASLTSADARAPAWHEALRDREAVEAATIAVEKTRGPVLLITGGDDRLWPADELAEIAFTRLRRHPRAYGDQHLRFPHAGHSVGWAPWLPAGPAAGRHPLTGVRYEYGGSPGANGAAGHSCWFETLALLGGIRTPSPPSADGAMTCP